MLFVLTLSCSVGGSCQGSIYLPEDLPLETNGSSPGALSIVALKWTVANEIVVCDARGSLYVIFEWRHENIVHNNDSVASNAKIQIRRIPIPQGLPITRFSTSAPDIPFSGERRGPGGLFGDSSSSAVRNVMLAAGSTAEFLYTIIPPHSVQPENNITVHRVEMTQLQEALQQVYSDTDSSPSLSRFYITSINAIGSSGTDWLLGLLQVAEDEEQPDVLHVLITLSMDMTSIKVVHGVILNEIQVSFQVENLSSATQSVLQGPSMFAVHLNDVSSIFLASTTTPDVAIASSLPSIVSSSNEPVLVVKPPETNQLNCAQSDFSQNVGCLGLIYIPQYPITVQRLKATVDTSPLTDPGIIIIVQSDGLLGVHYIDCPEATVAFKFREPGCCDARLSTILPFYSRSLPVFTQSLDSLSVSESISLKTVDNVSTNHVAPPAWSEGTEDPLILSSDTDDIEKDWKHLSSSNRTPSSQDGSVVETNVLLQSTEQCDNVTHKKPVENVPVEAAGHSSTLKEQCEISSGVVIAETSDADTPVCKLADTLSVKEKLHETPTRKSVNETPIKDVPCDALKVPVGALTKEIATPTVPITEIATPGSLSSPIVETTQGTMEGAKVSPVKEKMQEAPLKEQTDGTCDVVASQCIDEIARGSGPSHDAQTEIRQVLAQGLRAYEVKVKELEELCQKEICSLPESWAQRLEPRLKTFRQRINTAFQTLEELSRGRSSELEHAFNGLGAVVGSMGHLRRGFASMLRDMDNLLKSKVTGSARLSSRGTRDLEHVYRNRLQAQLHHLAVVEHAILVSDTAVTAGFDVLGGKLNFDDTSHSGTIRCLARSSNLLCSALAVVDVMSGRAQNLVRQAVAAPKLCSARYRLMSRFEGRRPGRRYALDYEALDAQESMGFGLKRTDNVPIRHLEGDIAKLPEHDGTNNQKTKTFGVYHTLPPQDGQTLDPDDAEETDDGSRPFLDQHTFQVVDNLHSKLRSLRLQIHQLATKRNHLMNQCSSPIVHDVSNQTPTPFTHSSFVGLASDISHAIDPSHRKGLTTAVNNLCSEDRTWERMSSRLLFGFIQRELRLSERFVTHLSQLPLNEDGLTTHSVDARQLMNSDSSVPDVTEGNPRERHIQHLELQIQMLRRSQRRKTIFKDPEGLQSVVHHLAQENVKVSGRVATPPSLSFNDKPSEGCPVAEQAVAEPHQIPRFPRSETRSPRPFSVKPTPVDSPYAARGIQKRDSLERRPSADFLSESRRKSMSFERSPRHFPDNFPERGCPSHVPSVEAEVALPPVPVSMTTGLEVAVPAESSDNEALSLREGVQKSELPKSPIPPSLSAPQHSTSSYPGEAGSFPSFSFTPFDKSDCKNTASDNDVECVDSIVTLPSSLNTLPVTAEEPLPAKVSSGLLLGCAVEEPKPIVDAERSSESAIAGDHQRVSNLSSSDEIPSTMVTSSLVTSAFERKQYTFGLQPAPQLLGPGRGTEPSNNTATSASWGTGFANFAPTREVPLEERARQLTGSASSSFMFSAPVTGSTSMLPTVGPSNFTTVTDVLPGSVNSVGQSPLKVSSSITSSASSFPMFGSPAASQPSLGGSTGPGFGQLSSSCSSTTGNTGPFGSISSGFGMPLSSGAGFPSFGSLSSPSPPPSHLFSGPTTSTSVGTFRIPDSMN